VVKAVARYRYQSGEHPGWPASEAARSARDSQALAITCLPGYGKAPATSTTPCVSAVTGITPSTHVN
jgi:hypothetical protein